MKATLYKPNGTETVIERVSARENTLDNDVIAAYLGCTPMLVDVLAGGDTYTVYSIFDSEDEINVHAMQVVANLTGFSFDMEEDEILRGPVLVVLKESLS